MRIDRIILRNFKGFESFDQLLNKRFTLIIGKNGMGKSSILDALSVAFGSFLLGIPVASARHIYRHEAREFERNHNGNLEFLQSFPIQVAAEGTLQDPFTNERSKMSWSRDLTSAKGRTTTKDAGALKSLAHSAYKAVLSGDDPTLPLLSYYGTGRLWSKSPVQKKGERPSRFDAYRNSHEPDVSPGDLMAWLKRMRLNEFETDRPSDLLAEWRSTVESCFDEKVRVSYSPSRNRLEVNFEERSQIVAYENLSHGQRTIVSMIGDIAFKAIILNPHLGAKAVAEARGVILIDEIDLHLHPRWQRAIIPALLHAFPGLQFVATTHSPFVIQSLNEGVMLDLDNMEVDDRVHNLPLIDIVEDVQKIEAPDRSLTYLSKMRSAEFYLGQVDRMALTSDPDELSALKSSLEDMESRFQDPALEALMKIERLTRMKRAEK